MSLNNIFWLDGWIGGWVNVKVVLLIVHSNHKVLLISRPFPNVTGIFFKNKNLQSTSCLLDVIKNQLIFEAKRCND